MNDKIRVSSRAIIFKENKILLIYRERDNMQYYVFPGGKIEPNESQKECIIREIKEEIGIGIKVIKKVYDVVGDEIKQHFFLCEWTSGEIGTGDVEEYKIDRLGGIQIPILVDINQLEKLQIVSEAIVSQLINDIKTFGLTLNNVPILINEKNYQKKEAL